MKKICTKCQQQKTLKAFSKHPNTKDRLRPRCKKCVSISYKQYYQNHRKAILKKNRIWAHNNRNIVNQAATLWKQRNPEKTKELGARYRKNHRKICRERSREWYDRNSKYCTQRHRVWRNKNSKQVNAYQRRHRKENLDHAHQREKLYRKAHPDINRASTQNYRARKLNALGRYTQSDIKKIRARQKDRCFYRKFNSDCKSDLKRRGTIDHKIPLSRHGTNQLSNLVLACATCNFQKHTKTDQEFIRYLNSGVKA